MVQDYFKTIGECSSNVDLHNAKKYVKSYIEVLADFINSYDYDCLSQGKRDKIVAEMKRCKKFMNK